MNSIIDRIRLSFTDSIQTKINAADSILNIVAEASEEIVQALLEGHKILTCGNGGSACDASISVRNVKSLQTGTTRLPAIALTSDMPTITAIANDYHYSDIFAKQIRDRSTW